MKSLILFFLIFGIFACQDSKNIEHTKHQTEQALLKANIAYEKELEKALYDLTIKARVARNYHKAQVAVERAKAVLQKSQKTTERLGKANTLENFIKIQEAYINWLQSKAKEWGLGLKFPQVEDSIWKNIISREFGKYTMHSYTSEVLGKLGATDLARGTHCGFDPPIIFLSNLKKVENGENIELSLFLKSYNRHYYADAKTNQGKIKEDGSASFGLTIPSIKLGKQSFEVAVRARNFVEDVDTTLYIQGTFEVIQ